MKSDLISESFNRKFGVILFVYDLMFGWSIMNVENYPKKAIEQRNIGTQIKTWTWMSANSLRATWPRRFSLNQSSLKFRTKFLVLNRSIQLHSLEGGLPSQAKCSPLPPPPPRYLFILRGVEGTVRVKWSAQEYDAMTQPGLERSELTIMAPRLPQVEIGIT